MRVWRRNRAVPGSGFTLVELLIAIAVIGMVLAIVLPYLLKVVRRNRVDASARQVQITLKAARLQAAKSGSVVGVYFDATNNRVQPFQDANGNGTFDSGEEFGKIGAVVLPSEVSIWKTTFPGDCIGFDRLGEAVSLPDATVSQPVVLTNCGDATNGCAAYIEDNPNMSYVQTAGPNIFRIGIDSPATGNVSLKKNTPGSTSVFGEPPWKWTY